MKSLLCTVILFSSIAYSAETLSQAPSMQSPAMMNDQAMLTIDAKSRLQDLLQAYDLLKKERGSPKVFLVLKNGEKLSPIVELTAMNNQTLLLVRYGTGQGTQLRVLAIEDLDSVMSTP